MLANYFDLEVQEVRTTEAAFQKTHIERDTSWNGGLGADARGPF